MLELNNTHTYICTQKSNFIEEFTDPSTQYPNTSQKPIVPKLFAQKFSIQVQNYFYMDGATIKFPPHPSLISSVDQ